MNIVLHRNHKYKINIILHNNNVCICIQPDERVTYRVNSWVPEPRAAANREFDLGYLNTSP